MLDSSSSSIGDISREWKQRAEETIKATTEEINRDNEKYSQSIAKRSNAQQIQMQMTKHHAEIVNAVHEGEENERNRQEWAKSQINELNEQTKNELQSIESLRSRQQAFYQQQLAQKNDMWEKLVLEKRAEANRLRNMIAQLNSDINVAKSEAKADIDEAKRRAKESTKIIRSRREEKIKRIADLTEAIKKEKSQFEETMKQNNALATSSVAQKKEQLARIQQSLLSMKAKLREKENNNSSKFRQQVRIISDLRAQLQVQKDAEKAKQNELMNTRKMCASVSRKISAYKDESASLRRQIAMMTKDNEELQGEIVKLEKQMFPQVFKPTYNF